MIESDAIVYVVDDDDAVRESLEGLIRSARLRVRTFASPQQFLSTPLEGTPGCLVLDVRLPELNGLEVQKLMAEMKLDLPIIFITAHGDVPTSVRAMKAGAVEFLIKPFAYEDLLKAIHEAIARNRLARDAKAETSELRKRYELLTTREQQVMDLVINGFLNKQIALKLNITEITVKVHRGQVMHKMQAGSLADLVKMSERLR